MRTLSASPMHIATALGALHFYLCILFVHLTVANSQIVEDQFFATHLASVFSLHLLTPLADYAAALATVPVR